MARYFDGVDDKIVVTRTAALDALMSSAYSIHLWLKTSTAVAAERLFCTADATEAYHTVIFNLPSVGKLKFYCRTGGDAAAVDSVTANLNNGAWRPLGFVRDDPNSKERIYVDGVEDANKALPGASAGADWDLTIMNYSTEYLLGTLAEFAWWNVVLNANEYAALAKGISACRIRPSALRVYLPLWGIG